MKAVDIIKETREYYENNERGLIGYSCHYITPKGNMCAVGRCCINPEGLTGSIITLMERVGKDSIDDLLKERYRGHPFQFWMDLQIFHDAHNNWNGRSLTDQGLEEYNDLMDTYK